MLETILAQFVLTIICYSKLDVIGIAHKTATFQINKSSTTIVHIVDICICIYIVFFSPRKSLYSLWLYTKSYSALSLTTNLSLNNVVFTCTFFSSNPEVITMALMHTSLYGDNQLQDMRKKLFTYKCWEDLFRTLG